MTNLEMFLRDKYPPDPPPEDGELGYTGPLEGNRDADLDLEPVPGQVGLDELLEERDPPIDRARELGLTR